MKLANKALISSITYLNIVRCWLSIVLILLPFQHRIAKFNILWTSETFSFVRYIDEITIIVFIPLAIIEFFRKKEIRDWMYIVLLFPILLLCACGLISGIINANPLYISVIGTFDYVRYFFVIFIFAAFFREVSEFKKIFRVILVLAVFIGGIAFIQELWAIFSRYVSEEYSTGKIYLLINSLMPNYPHQHVRFGIHRVSSLMNNFLFMGLYSLLILTIYSFTAKKVKIPIVIALFSGIFMSVSRMAYIGLIFVSGVHFFRNKSKRILIIIAMIPIVLLMFKLSALRDFNIMGQMKISEKGSYITDSGDNEISFREYSRNKAMTIWKDYPLWGVGPGNFGGVISVKFKSHIYELYNYTGYARVLLYRWKSIDQFWPIVIVETGIIGTAIFAALFITLFVILSMSKKRVDSEEIKGLFTGAQVFQVAILIYSIGNIINVTQVIFPFFAFVGMGLGCLKVNRI